MSARWALVALWFAGRAPVAGEHEACGGVDGPACSAGLDCVPSALCFVGPCPGTCQASCEAAACGPDAACEQVWDGWYCVPAS